MGMNTEEAFHMIVEQTKEYPMRMIFGQKE